MKNIKIITLLLSITLLCSCANSPFYRSIVVHPQVKEMVNKVLNKEITLDSLLIVKEEYYSKKNNENNMHYEKHGNSKRIQMLIDNFKPEDIINIRYEYGHDNSDDRNSMYICTVEYLPKNKKNNFQLVFTKVYDDMEYHLIEVTREGANELP